MIDATLALNYALEKINLRPAGSSVEIYSQQKSDEKRMKKPLPNWLERANRPFTPVSLSEMWQVLLLALVLLLLELTLCFMASQMHRQT